ncbi:MAG TPA: type II toxin-antitoxin system VapC family toxin [Terriglobales bacterium]|nr:type II toxin-antitoxin system VapC family toxin [Terriglobales bacterium]
MLLDSDVLIEVSRGRDRATVAAWQSLAAIHDAAIATTAVNIAELMRGVRAAEELQLSQILGTLTCIELDREIGERAGLYMRQYAPSHGLEVPDALVAATAALHRFALWTRNRKHFPMPELRFFQP